MNLVSILSQTNRGYTLSELLIIIIIIAILIAIAIPSYIGVTCQARQARIPDPQEWEGTWKCDLDPKGSDNRTVYLDGDIQESTIVFTYKDPEWDKPVHIEKLPEEIMKNNLNLKISPDNYWDLNTQYNCQNPDVFEKISGESDYEGKKYSVDCQKIA